MADLYTIKTSPRQQRILEFFRERIASTVGVTLQGNRLTVRDSLEGESVEVHMIIVSIEDDKFGDYKPEIHQCGHSMSGWCEYNLDEDPSMDGCIHCNEPCERK